MRRALLLYAALSLCFFALASWAEEQPLATRVEHFFVVSDQAQSLFTYFKDEFRLPEVWPFFEHGTFASGGISLGNAVLEFVSFPKKDNKPLKTEFQGIAFEPTADADATAAELTKRNIPHSGARTFKSQVPGRPVLVAWSSVALTDLPPKNADVFFCDYKDRQAVAQGRRAASHELAMRMGGPLGIVGAAEITVGVQDLNEARNKWSALLQPAPQISDDAFVFNTGPRIHLVHAESPGIQGIVLSVRSLGEAEKFLKERRLLAKDDAGHIAISPVAIDGLAIRLTAVTQAQDEVIFRMEVHADLVFHLLAHMDIGEDASSLYSPDYINMINREKARLAGATEPLEEKLAAAKKIYVPDQKLRMVNFLPFYCNGFESLWQGLKWLAEEEKGKSPNPDLSYFEQDFHSPEAKKFLSLFAFSMKSEYESFYKDYWERRQKELLPLKEKFSKFWRDKGLKFMRPAMRKYNKRCVIYLCLSMTQYGRGFIYPDIFGAAVKFPEIQEEILASFFFSIHEMTHQFMDEITLKSAAAKPGAASTMSGSEGYQIHLLMEKAVIYADYLLCQKFLPEYLEDYVRFFLGPTENIKPAQNVSFSKSKSEEKFRERFTIPGPTLLALKEFVASLSDDY
jgi:hypothetical protein